ncbi:MAG TPA: hypothetical protein VGA30_01845 [Actinomycetota bacterium]
MRSRVTRTFGVKPEAGGTLLGPPVARPVGDGVAEGRGSGLRRSPAATTFGTPWNGRKTSAPRPTAPTKARTRLARSISPPP